MSCWKMSPRAPALFYKFYMFYSILFLKNKLFYFVVCVLFLIPDEGGGGVAVGVTPIDYFFFFVHFEAGGQEAGVRAESDQTEGGGGILSFHDSVQILKDGLFSVADVEVAADG